MLIQKVLIGIIILLWLPVICSSQVFDSKTDSLLVLLETASSIKVRSEILIKLSKEYAGQDKVLSYKYANEAYYITKEQGSSEIYWEACISLSNAYNRIDNTDRSNEVALEALNVSRDLSDEQKIAVSLRILGGRMINLGSFPLASEYLFEALEYFENLDDTLNLSTTNILIGIIHYKLENPQESLKYYRIGLDIAMGLNNQVNISAALNNIAAIYEKLKEYDQALVYFQQALQINKERENVSWMANNYLNIGIVKYHQKKYNECLSLFNQSITIFDTINNKSGLALSWISLGKTYFQIGIPDSAYFYAQKALNLSLSKNLFEELIEASEFLTKYFTEKEKNDSIAFYTILTYQIHDSLNKKEHALQVLKMEQQYNFQKQQQAIELEQHRKDFIKIIFIGGLTASLLIIILLYSRLRIRVRHNKLQKHHIERELEFKNQELTANVVALMKRNEILTGLQNRLKTIESDATKGEVKKAIRQISKELGNMTDNDILSEFELRFKQVHKDFYDNLIKNYPDLWPSELKLCALLRLNMTTKEISELTGQTISTIEKARYRLRKKLNINSSDVNLVTFLSEF